MIPIGDSPRSRSTPFVTMALIAANLAVLLWVMVLDSQVPSSRAEAVRVQRELATGTCYGFVPAPTDIDAFYCRWSFQPEEWFDAARGESKAQEPRRLEVLLSILTSTFLHAGWIHLIGNMLFLWVFGDNVEDRLGHLRYLVFYLAGGVVAALAQGLVEPSSVVPVVGASGAVAAVLGAYLVLYPKARVTVLVPLLLFLPLPVPGVVMIGLWFVQNLLSGVASLSPAAPNSGVAFFAHIGGFVFGALLVWLFALGRPRRAERGGR
ncbi:MAG: rhomboid family intramembrane serine protease [Dehalococcoidia bacterium]